MATTEKSSAKVKAAAKIVEEAKKYIYIGPNIKGGKLTKYTVYKGMPEHCSELFEKLPELRHLFVPIAKLMAAEREVVTLGTPRNKYYKLALEVQDGI